MKKISLFLLLTSSLGFSQAIQGFGNKSGVLTPAQAGMSYRRVEIQGSPYIDQIFKKGITFINGNKTREALMRYNAFNDAIEILNENGNPRTLLRRQNIIAVIDGTKYIVLEYVESGNNKLGYFNPLNEGYTKLLLKPKKIFMQAENPDNGYDTFSPAKYEDVSTYYIKQGNNPAKETKLSKNKILNILDVESDVLKQYIKKNNLNLKSVNDVIRLFNYSNSQKLNSENTL